MDEMTVRIFPDGNQWCALWGDDLQSGIAGFGPTPRAALDEFVNELGSSSTVTTLDRNLWDQKI